MRQCFFIVHGWSKQEDQLAVLHRFAVCVYSNAGTVNIKVERQEIFNKIITNREYFQIY